MATTTNFGWATPDDTDFVKDGAAAIRTLGSSIDTSLVDLKGGTTGQILAKTSNTDMDFVWVANDVGDITAVTAGTGITGGGTSGDVTLSFDQANFGGGQFAAGKNKIINGDFRISQRGTSFSNPTSSTYTLDRWFYTPVTANPIAMTISQQTFTPGTAPVAGYEGANFCRMSLTTIGVGQTRSDITTRLEDCRLFAGETATLSFWAKSDSNRTNTMRIQRNFGSGGSSAETIVNPVSFSTTTAWTRFTFTFSISSISGKTIGTSSFIELFIGQAVASGCVLDIWGVQLEAGSIATPFQTATGTIQGELAACMRYYQRNTGTAASAFALLSTPGLATSTSAALIPLSMQIPLRTTATSCDFSTLRLNNGAAAFSLTNVTIDGTSSPNLTVLNVSGTATIVPGSPYMLQANNSTTAFVGFSAEL